MCCGVLQCVAVCCGVSWCVAVCCGVLRYVVEQSFYKGSLGCQVLQCVAVYFSVLQCHSAAVYCADMRM